MRMQFKTKFADDKYRKYQGTTVEILETPSWMRDKGSLNVRFFDGHEETVFTSELFPKKEEVSE